MFTTSGVTHPKQGEIATLPEGQTAKHAALHRSLKYKKQNHVRIEFLMDVTLSL
jgi:hypothetical protein